MRPYSGNAREHSSEQVAKIAASIERFGFNNPILVDADGIVVAGHGRLLAAQRLGLETVPVLPVGHLTDAERRAYTIADNRIALDATWNEEMLQKELLAIIEGGEIDLGLIGLGDDELERLLHGAGPRGRKDPDEAPAVAPAPVSTLGDLWILGDHRLVCGDSTNPETVGRLLAGAKPHLMVTDPPYGVEYDPAWRARVHGAQGGTAVGTVLNDDQDDWSRAWALFPGFVAYVWHGGTHAGAVERSLTNRKFKVRAQVIWVKTRPVLSRGDYHWQHEPCFYAVGEGADDDWRFVPEHEVAAYAVLDGKTGKWAGGRRQSTVWFIEHLKNDTGHGTQKPVECMRRPMVNNSRRGDVVYEPFSGSGTTIIAAQMVERRCFALELSPAYVDVAVKRWQEFTGLEATLEGDGRTFRQIAAERGVPLAA